MPCNSFVHYKEALIDHKFSFTMDSAQRRDTFTGTLINIIMKSVVKGRTNHQANLHI